MGALLADTEVVASGPASFKATISPDWTIWGPMGGYLAAIALRVAEHASPFERPASIACVFTGVATGRELHAECEVLRKGRSACMQRIRFSQRGRPIFEAFVCSTVPTDGLEHHEAQAPETPAPEALPRMEERFGDPPPDPVPFWANIDSRPVSWPDPWPPSGPLPPAWKNWYRMLPGDQPFDDPWLDAGRLAVLVDVLGWPAAQIHHRWKELPYIAPSLDLYVAFHGAGSTGEWLLGDGEAPTAAQGLIGWGGRLWSRTGRLVATGNGQLLCRRLPG